MGASCSVSFSNVQKNWIMEVTGQAQCVPWGRLACSVVLATFLPCRILVLLVYLGDKHSSGSCASQTVVCGQPVVGRAFPLAHCSPCSHSTFVSTLHLFGLWSTLDALHVQAFPFSLESTMLNSQGGSCSSCQKVRQTKGLLTPHSSANLFVPHLLHFLLQVASVSAVKFCTLQLKAHFGELFCNLPGICKLPAAVKAGRGWHTLTAGTHLSPAGPCLHRFTCLPRRSGISHHLAWELH